MTLTYGTGRPCRTPAGNLTVRSELDRRRLKAVIDIAFNEIVLIAVIREYSSLWKRWGVFFCRRRPGEGKGERDNAAPADTIEYPSEEFNPEDIPF